MQYRLHRKLFLDAVVKLQVINRPTHTRSLLERQASHFLTSMVERSPSLHASERPCTLWESWLRASSSCVQAAQPQGVHLPRTLWEYRKDFPIRASVYFSGLLAAPRLTIFWLLVSEREMVQRVHDAAVLRLHVILGEARQGTVQVQDAQRDSCVGDRRELWGSPSACLPSSPIGVHLRTCEMHAKNI